MNFKLKKTYWEEVFDSQSVEIRPKYGTYLLRDEGGDYDYGFLVTSNKNSDNVYLRISMFDYEESVESSNTFEYNSFQELFNSFTYEYDIDSTNKLGFVYFEEIDYKLITALNFVLGLNAHPIKKVDMSTIDWDGKVDWELFKELHKYKYDSHLEDKLKEEENREMVQIRGSGCRKINTVDNLEVYPEYGTHYLHYKCDGDDYCFKATLVKNNGDLKLHLVIFSEYESSVVYKSLDLIRIFDGGDDKSYTLETSIDGNTYFLNIRDMPDECVQVINFVLGLEVYKLYEEDLEFYETRLKRWRGYTAVFGE